MHRFPAQPVLTGQLGLRDPGGRPGNQLDNLLRSQGTCAAILDPAGLRRGDAFALALPDQGPFELGEGPHDREHQGRHRGILSPERQALLHELDPHPLPVRDCTTACRSSMLRANLSMECATPPARANRISSSSFGRWVFLPRPGR